jgi:3-deoxy-manno-octulosonate cytidylyltransferase (CMP-KDO synthetase)
MHSLIIIPARHESVRFPGKPLAALTARDGVTRPLVEWVWRAGVAAAGPDVVVVATDSAGIADCVAGFGGRAVMTSASLRNGTERCAAVLRETGLRPEIVVNLQGDSPLVPPHHIAALLEALERGTAAVATPYVSCDALTTARIQDDARAGRIGGTCVVTRADGRAAYFSKYPIPHGAGTGRGAALPLKLHVGLYAYRHEALAAYLAMPPSPLELAEGLEQLRFLDAGWPIEMVEVPLPEGGLWEVNNPEDVALVEAALPLAGG